MLTRWLLGIYSLLLYKPGFPYMYNTGIRIFYIERAKYNLSSYTQPKSDARIVL